MRLPLRLLALALLLPAAGTAEEVILREEALEIPTYEVGPPEAHPIFFDGRAYQGAKGPIYPYPLLDKLSTTKVSRTWRAVRLENRYLEILVLPGIGGRIFAARDKTNGYDVFYRQHVIKPALIGMAGAWISGGVEWNVFHHHRVTSFMPVDYALRSNPDGSKTVWIGETERRHRMRWIIGLTLRPGSARLETVLRCFNRTPLEHAFLYFANPAVAVNDDYQVIFPPATVYATSHTKDAFVEWPVGKRRYKGVDYAGVDLSWIKNHPKPNSFFAWNEEDTWIAGYDHGRDAGVMHVADPRLVPGKKLWQWGVGPTGKMWEKILTDADGPYAEVMVGAFSDNQPDYSWIRPAETKSCRQVWYPIRGLGGVTNATVDAAAHLEAKGTGVRIAFCAPTPRADARVRLVAGGKVLFERMAAVAPETPFAAEVPLPAGVRPEDCRASLQAADGRELVAAAIAKPERGPMPEPYRPPPAPADLETAEALYLAGSRLEQFYNPRREPDPYYAEALRRDPGDIRVNTALGILHLKRLQPADAETCLRKAVARTTANHTKARDGAPHYYLGVALCAQGRDAEAGRAFAAAAWDRAFAGPAWYALAEIACRRGDGTDALEGLKRALAANANHTRALALTAAILRRMGALDDAASIAAGALAADPLDFWAANEAALVKARREEPDAARALDALKARMRGDAQSHLELACDYAAVAMWDEAIDVLGRLVPGDVPDGSPEAAVPAVDPMVFYHLGRLWERKGETGKAARCRRVAARMPWPGCFPFRRESVDVLRAAMKADPKDARAPLYLGNLLYDHQPDRAVAVWEQAAKIDRDLAPAHRNLGFAHLRRGDAARAVAAYEAALACDRSDPRILMELDDAHDLAGTRPAKRIAPLEANRETVLKKDRAVARLARLCVILGRLDEAIELLTTNHFHLWEGEAGVYGLYVEARVCRAEARLAAGRAAEALADLEAALVVPPGIEVWQEFSAGRARVRYVTGLAHKALGNDAKARDAFERAAEAKGDGAAAYDGARALFELGKEEEARKRMEALASRKRGGAVKRKGEHFRVWLRNRRNAAEAHYAAALGLLGLGKADAARAVLKKALALDNSHVGAWRLWETAERGGDESDIQKPNPR